jgi:predicted transporter
MMSDTISDIAAIILLGLCAFAIISKHVHMGFTSSCALACFVISSLAELDPFSDERKISFGLALGAIFIVIGLILRGLGVRSFGMRIKERRHDHEGHNVVEE